jgi:hypothetical protein
MNDSKHKGLFFCFGIKYILDNGTDLTGCRLAFASFLYGQNRRGIMAREIRETPIWTPLASASLLGHKIMQA